MWNTFLPVASFRQQEQFGTERPEENKESQAGAKDENGI